MSKYKSFKRNNKRSFSKGKRRGGRIRSYGASRGGVRL